LALISGYLLGIPSERKLMMELQRNMVLRWFVGLNLDQDAWRIDVQPGPPALLRCVGCAGEAFRRDGEASDGRGAGEPPRMRRRNAGAGERELQEFVPIEVAMDPDEYTPDRVGTQPQAPRPLAPSSIAGPC